VTRHLQRKTKNEKGIAPRQLVPDFELVDQTGAPFRLSDVEGQVVALTFIYTRCPLPEFCPRALANFSALRDRFKSRMGRDLTLLTITLDPTYDTPERLHDYMMQTGTGGASWRFLTGSRDAVDRVRALFGVEAWPEEGVLTHAIVTVVIDRRGRLAGRFEGPKQSIRKVGDAIARLLKS